MTFLFGRDWSAAELLQHVGDMSQLCGARLLTYTEGPEAGLQAAEVRSGSGFNFVVLPGRGMDIGFAEYRGTPLCWRSATGDVSASFYDPSENGWLRGFGGGLMATCGLTQAGWPSTDEGQQLPLHGRASYLPARNVQVDSAWQGDHYVISVVGRTREATVYAENIQLTRRIWTRLGENRLFVDDEVVNLGYATVPHMIAYHVNVGFPVLDEGSRLEPASRKVEPLSEEFADAVANYTDYIGPRRDWPTKVLVHRPEAGADGWAETAVANERLGLALYVKQRPEQLPFLWQWKQLTPGTYVTGVEPANCFGRGRADDRARGTLQFLEPGERRTYNVEIGVKELR